MEHRLILVAGPSGVGKRVVLQIVRDMRPELRHTVSHTTRARRPGEINGRDYHYIDRAAFREMERLGEFLETNEHSGQLYGTHRNELEPGVMKIAEIEINGVRQVKEHLPGTQMIFMLPDSKSLLSQRIIGRSVLPQEEIDWRLARGAREIEEGPNLADHFVVNPEGMDNCDRVAKDLLRIIDRILAS
jgi:guanylate kinase